MLRRSACKSIVDSSLHRIGTGASPDLLDVNRLSKFQPAVNECAENRICLLKLTTHSAEAQHSMADLRPQHNVTVVGCLLEPMPIVRRGT
jgi:hypothetical protein